MRPRWSHECDVRSRKKLATQKMQHTKVILLFKPAEENWEVAVALMMIVLSN